MFSATPDSMIQCISLMFKISSFCLKVLVKTHSDPHICSQTQGNVPSQAEVLSEGCPEVHRSEDVFHSKVPSQVDISMCNQRVSIRFAFRVCMCMTFL